MSRQVDYYLIRWFENGKCVDRTEVHNTDNLEGVEGIDYTIEEIYEEVA